MNYIEYIQNNAEPFFLNRDIERKYLASNELSAHIVKLTNSEKKIVNGIMTLLPQSYLYLDNKNKLFETPFQEVAMEKNNVLINVALKGLIFIKDENTNKLKNEFGIFTAINTLDDNIQLQRSGIRQIKKYVEHIHESITEKMFNGLVNVFGDTVPMGLANKVSKQFFSDHFYDQETEKYIDLYTQENFYDKVQEYITSTTVILDASMKKQLLPDEIVFVESIFNGFLNNLKLNNNLNENNNMVAYLFNQLTKEKT